MKLFTKNTISQLKDDVCLKFNQPAEITIVLEALHINRELRQSSVTTELLLDLVDGNQQAELCLVVGQNIKACFRLPLSSEMIQHGLRSDVSKSAKTK